MGLTPFACVTLPDSIRIVYPDGNVDSLSRSCSVSELLHGNPDYYVCGSFPHTPANSLASNEYLEKGLTYFVCASPNAQPFLVKKSRLARPARMLPRLSRRGMREMRSPTHHSKVFDVHSAALQQQLESLHGERAPKNLHQLKIVFVRHCLQALRLPRMDPFADEPVPFPDVETQDQACVPEAQPQAQVASPAPVDVLPIFRSPARCELGLYVSRRQEFYLRRARRRRKVVWKPVLQSICETAPVVEFRLPGVEEESENHAAAARFSPRAPPRKNISPPRQPVCAPPKNISPPRQAPSVGKHSSSAPHQHQHQQQHHHQQQHQQYQQQQQQQQNLQHQQPHLQHQQYRSRGNSRSLYLA